MRTAFVSYDHGEYCVRLASALSRETEVLLLLPRELAAPHQFRLARSVDFRPFHKPRLRQVLPQLGSVRWLVEQVRWFDPDVIHVQHGHLWFNLALPLLGRYPLVITVHDPRPHLGDRESRRTPQAVYDFGFRRASQLIVHGSSLRTVLVRELGVPETRVHVIPHIVLGDDARADRGEEEPHTILFFGRIWRYKGLEYLIRAEPAITSAVPEARIIIAGTGEDFARYRGMMIHPERFEVRNEYISDDERATLFARASVVVLPYVEATQSGIVPLAYTFSKPVVATTVGALPEAVDHGETGYLVPPRDEGALAEAIICLLQDADLRRRLGAAGKRKIKAEASPETVADATLQVYQHALAGIPSRARQEVEC